jgi:hypothetical protein
MDKNPVFTALVGSSFAGKSTLLADLSEACSLPTVNTIPEYCANIGGNKNFRRIPFDSLEEAKTNINDFIHWEQQRQLHASMYNRDYPIVMDRTLYCFLLTQLMLAKFRPAWFNAYDYGVNTVATEIACGRLILPQRLILLEPEDEATFLSRTTRGVSVSLFSETIIWRFFSRCYQLIMERLYDEGRNLTLYSSNSLESRVDLARQVRDFVFSDKAMVEVTLEDFLEVFAELRGLATD